jgi:hypothetical protein
MNEDTSKSKTVLEEAKHLPVIHETDLCVVGGSCTGTFAALRAARMGLRVAIVEAQNCFGGVATNAMVNIWHSLYDTDDSNQIIAGLTEETIERLKKRKAVTVHDDRNPMYFVLNTEELKIELDEMVTADGVQPFLHTLFCAPYVQDGQLAGIIVENKDGRGVILARTFIDASGDGDLAARLGLETYYANRLQPGTTCAKIARWSDIDKYCGDIKALYQEHKSEYDLPETSFWGAAVPGDVDAHMLAASRISLDMSKAGQLTAAEIEGRRQVRAIMDMLREYCPEADPVLLQLPARIGVRETRHVRCEHHLTGVELMLGTRFKDAIANGTYPSDLHHAGGAGITFRYLNGVQILSRPGLPAVESRWREPLEEDPRFYQVPYRSMVPENSAFPNLIVAGRMIDSDEMAHAAIRVMVNMNQTGEAAGVAAYLAMNESIGFAQIDTQKLRRQLQAGGSCIV